MSNELIVILIVSFGVPTAALGFFSFKFWEYERSVNSSGAAKASSSRSNDSLL